MFTKGSEYSQTSQTKTNKTNKQTNKETNMQTFLDKLYLSQNKSDHYETFRI